MAEKRFTLYELAKYIEDNIWAPKAISDPANKKYVEKIGDPKVVEKAGTHYVTHVKEKFGIEPAAANVRKYELKLRMAGFGTKEGAEELNRRRVAGIKEADARDEWVKSWIPGMFGIDLEKAKTIVTKVPKIE